MTTFFSRDGMPARLRDEVRRARQPLILGPPKRSNLTRNFIVSKVPRDILSHIACFLPSTADISHLDCVNHAFHSPCGGAPSVVHDALRLRCDEPLVDACFMTTQELMRAERLRELLRTLVTESDGCRLELSVDSNTGYDGVEFCAWKKPFAYSARVDGVNLGSFSSAVAAACAVAQYRYVEAFPML